MPRLQNDRHERFALELVKTPASATDAYLKAGYEVKSREVARINASRLLTNATVADRVTELRARVDQEGIKSAVEVVKGIQALAFFNPKDIYKKDGSLRPVHELPDEALAAIATLDVDVGDGKVKYKIDRKGALELLGKHHRLFGEQKERGETGRHLQLPARTLRMIEQTKKRLALIEGVPESELRKLKERQVEPPDPNVE